MSKYKILLTLGFLLIASNAIAGTGDGAFRVSASVDKKSILIGDRIKYTIEAVYKTGGQIAFPEFKEARIGDFEIKDSGARLKKSIFGNTAHSKWYYITTYSTGDHVIPQIDIKYKERTAKDWAIEKTKPIGIRVTSVLPKGKMPSDIKDIKGPLYFFEINWLYVSIAFAGIFIIWFIIYRRGRKRAPRRLPHEVALEELEAVKNLLSRKGDVKEYYVGISDCIRRYIERVFRLRAPEMTTEEFLNYLRDSETLSPQQKKLLKDFLNACDLVKFAKYMPTRTEIESVLVTARIFVEGTKDIFGEQREKG